MVKYGFRQEDFEIGLQELANRLNIPLQDNYLTLPASLGKGTIMAQNINRDLSFAVIDVLLEKDLELEWESGGRKGFNLCFTQVLGKKNLSRQSGLNTQIEDQPLSNDILLEKAEEPGVISLQAGFEIKKLLIFYSGEIARQYLPEEIYDRIADLAHSNISAANKHFISLSHRENLRVFFEDRNGEAFLPIRRLSHIVQLTEKFLYAVLRQGQTPLNRAIKKNDLESMQHVEQILSRNNLEGFPSLESLAQEVFMSTSKLKNLFKDIYGYTLYDYYNKCRLRRAKEMLVTGQYSIKQAGSDIGFSNLSHFAKAFRKEFGVLPRELVKSR